MNDTFSRLFSLWCLPYEYLNFPEHLENNPIKAYGEYAFEEGIKFAFELMAPLLTKDDFNPYRD